MSGALMVCGTASGVGKSLVVTGLCRLLARKGVRVAPFKAQNMSNNSAVTADGAEIGRAQYAQAQAAGVEPEAAMNPVLLKPTGDRTSQVVVLGRALPGSWNGEASPVPLSVPRTALRSLRERFEVVMLEGAGGAGEINLLDRDIVNLPLAAAESIPAIVVGDIERGGVFASLYGTVALLPDHLRACVRGFVINRFRGDPSLLDPGLVELEARTGVPVLGVLPWLTDVAGDDEDSMDVAGFGDAAASVDVAVIRLPHVSNFTDLDPLRVEPDVRVRYVSAAGQLGRPDVVVVPGTKATVDDLAWLRATGMADAIAACGALIVGICGGYQMLGRRIVDDVESGEGAAAGLGWLDVETVFEPDKVVRRGCAGRYEIHHGRVDPAEWWTGPVGGTVEHGLFDDNGFRRRFVGEVGGTPGTDSWAAHREARFNRLADALEAHLDLAALEALWS